MLQNNTVGNEKTVYKGHSNKYKISEMCKIVMVLMLVINRGCSMDISISSNVAHRPGGSERTVLSSSISVTRPQTLTQTYRWGHRVWAHWQLDEKLIKAGVWGSRRVRRAGERVVELASAPPLPVTWTEPTGWLQVVCTCTSGAEEFNNMNSELSCWPWCWGSAAGAGRCDSLWRWW